MAKPVVIVPRVHPKLGPILFTDEPASAPGLLHAFAETWHGDATPKLYRETFAADEEEVAALLAQWRAFTNNAPATLRRQFYTAKKGTT